MAGFRVAYACEFDKNAVECYRLNAALETTVDRRDVREVSADDIERAAGGHVDVLDGSPPCQSFSMSGKRRLDDPRGGLFEQYARLLSELRPDAFVAENVYGLVVGTAKGRFKEILRVLSACGYDVSVKILDAQWLGVPQRRRRVIFVGTRRGFDIRFQFPAPLPYRYNVSDAIDLRSNEEIVRDATGSWKRNGYRGNDQPSPTITTRSDQPYVQSSPSPGKLPKNLADEWARLPLGGQSSKYFNLIRSDPNLPSGCVVASNRASVTHPLRCRKFTISELKRLCSFPDDFRLVGSFQQQWARLGNSVPPLMMRAVAERLCAAFLEARRAPASEETGASTNG